MALTTHDPVLECLDNATALGAEEVYFEVEGKRVRIRWRVEGLLRSAPTLRHDEEQALLRTLKKDRVARTLGDSRYRAVLVPTKGGFVLFVRVLEKECSSLEEDTALYRALTRLAGKSWGLLLFVGPRASGKTRLCLSSLGLLPTEEWNMTSCVFPPDFDLHGVNQIDDPGFQSSPNAAYIRKLLAPNQALILGDIGTGDAATAAVEAAIGRLVLATLESDDTVTAIEDLMHRSKLAGFSHYDLSRVLTAVVATRLLRRLCDGCKNPHAYPVDELVALGMSEEEARGTELARGEGCRDCRNSGYNGLVQITEILEPDEALREAIARGASSDVLHGRARRLEMPTLRHSALEALRSLRTTPEEIVRQSFLAEIGERL